MLFGCVPGSATPTVGCLIFFNGSLEAGEEFFEREPDARQSYIAWEIYSINKVNTVPGDAMAFANRGNYQNGIVVTRCTHPTKDKKHRDLGRHIRGLFRDEFEKSRDEHAKKACVRMYGNYIERKCFSFVMLLSFLVC